MSQVDTPKRLPLVITPGNRDSSTLKDSRLVNCYVEKQEDGSYWIYRRQGLAPAFTNTGVGRGAYNWRGNVYTIFGSTLYKDNIAVAGAATLDTTNGLYRFSQTLGATPRLVMGNGVKAYTWDNTTFAQITDGDFPAAFVKGWAYLDGTTYVTLPSAGVQGSGLNDPTAWDPLNIIIAQIEPDLAVGMNKQLVYVIIFKQWSTEVFYDAGNSVGSPLGTVQGAKASYGCVSGDTVQEIDDILFWVATNRQSTPQVVMMEKLKVDVVSTAPVERLLVASNFSSINSFCIKTGGHAFYVLTLKDINLTLAYDMKEKMWSQWTDASSNYFPICAVTFDSAMRHVAQHESNGKLYYMSLDTFGDDGVNIQLDLITPNFDGGERFSKNLQRMDFIADRVTGSNLLMRYNDEDYDETKWSNFETIDLGQPNPYTTNLGSFYRRAFHLRHAQQVKFRLQAIDLQIAEGSA